MRYNFYLIIFLFLAVVLEPARADTRITDLPSGSGAATTSSDVFPYVDVTNNKTKKMTLWDLVNVQPFAAPTFCTAKPLTGYSVSSGTVNSSDTVLSAIEKLAGNSTPGAPVTVGSFDGQPASANGVSINSNVLYEQSADATHPGLVNTGPQTIAGAKTFTGGVTASVTGHASQDLQASNNLSDLGNAGTARTNLGLGTAATGNAANFTVGTGLTISAGTGTGAALQAMTVGIAAGYYLPTTTDQSTWNAKQDALTFTAPLVNTLGTVTCNVASGSQAGCLSSSDWTSFSGKQAAGNYITGTTGDVVATGPGSVSATIQAGAVSNAKMANMAAHTIKGNNTGSSAVPIDLTDAQATAELVPFVGDSGSGGTQGVVPAPASGDAAANKYLKADGTWSTVDGLPSQTGNSGKYLTTDGSSSSWASLNTSANTRAISQTAHGLSVCEPVYDNAGTFAAAKADADATAEAVGIVSAVTDSDHFVLLTSGYITGCSGLTAHSTHWLSDSSAGALTATEPTTVGHISKALLWADSTSSGYFMNMRGWKNAESVTPSDPVYSAAITDGGAGSTSVASQKGSWISSVTHNATGDVKIVPNTGKFSAAPICTCSTKGGFGRNCSIENGSTTSLIEVYTASGTTAGDYNFEIHCQ